MKIEELQERIAQAKRTSDYEFERVVLELTEEICDIMEAKGWSRSDLASRMGRSKAWVTKILGGDQNLTLRTIVSVFRELNYRLKLDFEYISDEANWEHKVMNKVSSTVTVPSVSCCYVIHSEIEVDATNITDLKETGPKEMVDALAA